MTADSGFDAGTVWLVILLLGAGTYLIRFSFLGLIGSRKLPALFLRLLRYTPVAVLPGIAAPGIFFGADGGTLDPARLAAAVATIAVGWWLKNVLAGILAGAVTLAAVLLALGAL